MNDVAVIAEIMRPPAMRAAAAVPPVVAVLAGAPDVAVAWLAGWAAFAVRVVFAHRERRRRILHQPIGAPVNPRVRMLDGRTVRLRLRRVDQNTFENADPIVGTPRSVIADSAAVDAEVRLRG